MLLISLLFWLRALLPGEMPAASGHLFPFAADAIHWGYLDATGRPVIAARFQAAQPFAEGLAAVREQGRYGYVAPNGELRIPAIYDYATPFQGGYALVWLQGQPLVLNQQGRVQFRHAYKTMQLLPGLGSQPPSCLVSTRLGKQGITDVHGQLLVDTVFQNIRPFQSGVSVVTGLRHGRMQPLPDDPEDSTALNEIGVIDRRGHWRVGFGRYREIKDFTHGYTIARLPLHDDRHDQWQTEVLLGSTGRECYMVPSLTWKFPYGSLHFTDGVAAANINLVRPDTIKVWSSDRRYHFASLVDTQGRLRFRNEDLDRILPFAEGRSFAQTQDKKWHLIDNRGRFVTPQAYDGVVDDLTSRNDTPPFYHGQAFVLTNDDKLVGLDTAGRVVVPARSFGFEYDKVFREGDFLIFQEDISQQNDRYDYRYGFWRPGTNLLVPPRFHDMASLRNFTAGTLLAVVQDGRPGYLNETGSLVWQQPKQTAVGFRNVDYMNRATYTVSSEPLAKYAGLGGWASSRNGARRAKAGLLSRNSCSVVVETKATPGSYQQQWAGHKLQIANTTADTIVFDAQDSMLYLSLEARDEQGRWRAIEYVPQSWCGNSYHTVFLAPGQAWQLVLPAYRGTIPTRLRARLVMQNSRQPGAGKAVYSNEFEGSVNPAQFWRQLGYQPAGLMDPYNN